MNAIDFKPHQGAVLVCLFLYLIGAGALAGGAYCAEIPESQAVRAIIGEAASEGYQGMLAVAAAIRNRGHLGGVYGLRAGHVDREPGWVWDMAKKAWQESLSHDPTKGADHWESIAFKTPTWAKGMQVTYRYKQHVFYKSNR